MTSSGVEPEKHATAKDRRLPPLAAVVFAAVLAFALVPKTASAQVPHLVKDLNATNLGSYPSGAVEMNGSLYFEATVPDHGSELWRTDGTPRGTWLVKDVLPGPDSASPSLKVEMGGNLYFLAYAADRVRELWRTNGTAAGTRLVKNLESRRQGSTQTTLAVFNGKTLVVSVSSETEGLRLLWISDGTPGGTEKVEIPSRYTFSFRELGGRFVFQVTTADDMAELWASNGTVEGTRRLLASKGKRPTFLHAFGRRLFFLSDDGVHGRELWTTQGTKSTTRLVKDIRPGADSSDIGKGISSAVFASNGRLFFSADDGVHGSALWTSDGTENGTRLVREPQPGEASGSPRNFFELGGRLFFLASGPEQSALWTTDGSEAGTSLITELPSPWNPADAVTLDERLFFALDGRELWSTDGTKQGTRRIKRFAHDEAYPRQLSAIDRRLLFIAYDGVHGLELWTSNGTTAGTRIVKEIGPGLDNPFFYGKYGHDFIKGFVANGRFFFLANDGSHGHELWVTDGTSGGTYMLKDVNPGMYGSWPDRFGELNGQLLFRAYDGVHGVEPWTTDATQEGTTLLRDINSEGTGGSNPGDSADLGGNLYFAAQGCAPPCKDPRKAIGYELWRSDGTAGGTSLVRDLHRNGSSYPRNLTTVGGRLFFTADDGVHGYELWTSDGTRAGTRMVKDIYRSVGYGSHPEDLVGAGNRLFFIVEDRLWTSDGSKQGTHLVRDLHPEGYGYSPYQLFAFGDRLVFSADDGEHGQELWISDGTELGTKLVADIEPGEESSSPFGFVELGDRIFFAASDTVHGTELWSSDGTEAGTHLVKDVWPGESNSYPSRLTEVDGDLYFFADDGVNGEEFWTSDGTEAGTRILKDIRNGALGSDPSRIVESEGRLFFSANDGAHGQELWTSDRTERGTLRLTDIRAGREDSVSQYSDRFAAVGGRLFFGANDRGRHGDELWSSDGTRKGTRLIADINLGRASSYPGHPGGFAVAGRTLFFPAESAANGIELWALSAGLPAEGVPKLLTLTDLDGLGEDEFAVLSSEISVLEGGSGTELLSEAFAPTPRWKAVDFEIVDGLAKNSTKVAVLAHERNRARIFVRDILGESAGFEVPLLRKHPVDLEIVPSSGAASIRAAVLTWRGLGRGAGISVVPLTAGGSPTLQLALPRDFEALDLEVARLPKLEDNPERFGLVVLGRSDRTIRVLTLDADTGEHLAEATLESSLVPLQLAIVQERPLGPGRASVLARKRNGAARIITLNLANGSVIRTVRLSKGRVPLDLEAEPGRRRSAGPNVAVLWTDKDNASSGVSTRDSLTGKKIAEVAFPGVSQPKDFSLIRHSVPRDGIANAVLGEAECADQRLAVVVRDPTADVLLGCFPVD